MALLAFITLSFDIDLIDWLQTYAHHAHKSPQPGIDATNFQKMLPKCNKAQRQKCSIQPVRQSNMGGYCSVRSYRLTELSIASCL
jgi:hypothetical protein